MRQKMKQLMGILLSLVLMLGLMPGLSLTAYADGTTYNPASLYTDFYILIANDAVVTISEVPGKTWYVIADDGSTVTLLSKESFGSQAFNSSGTGNDYATSDIKTYVDELTGEGQPLEWISSVISDLTLIDKTTAQALSETKLKGAGTDWWLRSPGENDNKAAYVNGLSGRVGEFGPDVNSELGVRPALKLDLSSVIFKSESGSYSFELKPSHTHSFTYAASSATITATCSNTDDCPLSGSEYKATLTIAAPAKTTYGDTNSAESTITDANSIQGDAKVQYQKKTDGSYGTATETAPTDAGDYKASITVGGATASVEYTIAQADPTANAPTGLTATYGQTLANVSLEGKNPEGNTPGTWAWADSTQSVGNVVSPAATFKANFTPTSSNYKTVENVEVSVTVGKAANPATVTGTATVIKGGNTVDLKDNVTKNGATGDVGYAIDGEAKDCTLDGSVLTSGDTTGTVTVNVTVAADGNYNALAATPITVTISDKGTQTITAADVTVTYGDTDKKVNASVTDPATGGGEISYAVKDGSGDYIDVDASTGALNIKKVPTDGKAYVTVTAAGTAAYEQATKDVTVTIAKADPTVTAPTAKTLTYDGSAQALVNAGSATGGTMYYAVTTENTAPTDDNLYTTSIPTKTDVGTYYVWYKVVGDEHHADTEPACITVTIAEGDKPAPVQDIYVVTEGAGSTWAKGSGKELLFTFKRTVDDDTTYKRFIGIKVDGKVVDSGNYTATAGSVKIALKPSYLETLAVSEHVLTALFDDGSVDVKFTVTAAQDPSSSSSSVDPSSSATATSSKASASSKATTPSTGDAIPIALIAACAALGAIAVFVSRVRMRRQAGADSTKAAKGD